MGRLTCLSGTIYFFKLDIKLKLMKKISDYLIQPKPVYFSSINILILEKYKEICLEEGENNYLINV